MQQIMFLIEITIARHALDVIDHNNSYVHLKGIINM